MIDPMDEEFNRVEMESRIKQEYIRAMRKTTREEKISRPAVYEVPTETVLQMADYIRFLENSVRELNDRLAKLERGNEPATCPICRATAYPYPKCGCVFYKEKNT